MNCDGEGCVWSLFGGIPSSGCVESEMFRQPRGPVIEADRHPSLELRKGMWTGLGPGGCCKCLVSVAGHIVFMLP